MGWFGEVSFLGNVTGLDDGGGEICSSSDTAFESAACCGSAGIEGSVDVAMGTTCPESVVCVSLWAAGKSDSAVT